MYILHSRMKVLTLFPAHTPEYNGIRQLVYKYGVGFVSTSFAIKGEK